MIFKRIYLLGILIFTPISFAGSHPEKKSQHIVAWDIHGVLCTKQKYHGYECEPIEEAFALVKELYDKGVEQVLLSNISARSFHILIRTYPDYFFYFNQVRSLTDAQGCFTRKPHEKYFKKFLYKNPEFRPEDILFFDDKPKNVHGARKVRIDGQLFCGAEHARALLVGKGYL